MSRSTKRNFYQAYRSVFEEHGGRVPVIRAGGDREVSHSKACYICQRGTLPKRILHIKPRRRREKEALRKIMRDEY